MKKLYIFDLDGTLVNSIGDLADSMNTVLERHGFPVHEVGAYKFFVGNGTLKLVERALPEDKRTQEMIVRLHEEFSEVYRDNAVRKTVPYEGIKELLGTLKDRGCKLAVASNKPHEFSVKITETLFGKDVFDVIYGKRDGVPTKPSPEIMLDIMKDIGVRADECVHSGDSAVDIMTAKNAGIDCVVGCTWGFRPREELTQAGAQLIADKAQDILTLTEKL